LSFILGRSCANQKAKVQKMDSIIHCLKDQTVIDTISGSLVKISYETTESFKSSSSTSTTKPSSSYSSGYGKSSGRINLNNTLSKAEHNSAMQIMNKKRNAPLDKPFADAQTKRNQTLSHLNDYRISRHGIRRK